MSKDSPVCDDYIALFDMYGHDLGSIYKEPEDDRYALLFEQLTRLLVRPTPFNLSLPEPFRLTAHRWRAGEAATIAHMSDPANRHFMLCDLHDLIKLKHRMAARRQAAEA